jgi:hypothetical protein
MDSNLGVDPTARCVELKDNLESLAYLLLERGIESFNVKIGLALQQQ